jgi:transcriptional regulator with XRE-family HTH domain
MIKNERQYRITKAQVQEFEQALSQALESAEGKQPENSLLWQAQVSALESQLDDLQEEVREYENLISSSVDGPNVLELDSLEALPLALIKARIATKLSQKDLAERLGLKEQQIQRYEATEYASASFSRVMEICHALSITLKPSGKITLEVSAVDTEDTSAGKTKEALNDLHSLRESWLEKEESTDSETTHKHQLGA